MFCVDKSPEGKRVQGFNPLVRRFTRHLGLSPQSISNDWKLSSLPRQNHCPQPWNSQIYGWWGRKMTPFSSFLLIATHFFLNPPMQVVPGVIPKLKAKGFKLLPVSALWFCDDSSFYPLPLIDSYLVFSFITFPTTLMYKVADCLELGSTPNDWYEIVQMPGTRDVSLAEYLCLLIWVLIIFFSFACYNMLYGIEYRRILGLAMALRHRECLNKLFLYLQIIIYWPTCPIKLHLSYNS